MTSFLQLPLAELHEGILGSDMDGASTASPRIWEHFKDQDQGPIGQRACDGQRH